MPEQEMQHYADLLGQGRLFPGPRVEYRVYRVAP
jgi:hypothetical protein